MSDSLPATLDFETIPDVAIGRCDGDLTLSDIESAASAMLERLEAYPSPPRHMLWDLSQASLDLQEDERHRLVRFISARAGEPRGRTAYVASGDLAYGLMRVYRAIRASEDDQINVFRDHASAVAWIQDA